MKGARDGNAIAQYALGLMYMKGDKCVSKDEASACFWLTKSAERGFDGAMVTLGDIYLGRGNAAKAESLYKEAVSKGRGDARMKLADMYYENGDYAKALPLYTEEAEDGEIGAMEKLAVMYAEGKGVKRSESKAKHWREELEKANEELDKMFFNLLF